MEKDNTQSSYELLHKLVYAEKKVPRHAIKCINITVTIEDCQREAVILKKASIIVLALSKILNRRFKALVDDCGNLLQLLTVRKLPRMPQTRNITLNTEDGVYIDDVVGLLEGGIEFTMDIDGEEIPIGMDIEFGDAPSIEQARDSTMMASQFLDVPEISVNVKRKRVIQDRTIEISENVFRENLRNVRDILRKEEGAGAVESKVWLEKRIAELFRRREEDATIEEERRTSVEHMVDFVPELDMNTVEMAGDVEDKSEADLTGLQDFTVLGDEFKFGEVVKETSSLEKARSFMSLLVELTEGNVQAKQDRPFSEIECRAVRR